MKILINEVSTSYQKIGSSKNILVMLHGWGCDWQIFAPVIPELSKKYKLIIPDLPCFGDSDCPTQSWDSYEYADWLAEFTNKVISSGKYSLLGHSFGGKISAIFASQSSRQITKLILVDSSGLPDPLTIVQQISKSTSRLIPSQVKNLIPSSFKKKVLARAGVATDHLNSTPAQRKILKKIVRENITNDLIKIKTPALIIWGKNDADTPPYQGKEFHQLIKNSKFEVFENSGHFPFIDESEKFVDLI